MTSRGRRERSTAVVGRGLALVLALAVVGSGSPLFPGSTAARAAEGGRAPKVPVIAHKSRNFRIPFNVDPADRPRLKEVQLWVSEDSGYNWKTVSRTTPDRPVFTYRAAHDGEFWFAVRTVDTKGRIFPSKEETVEPNMKVIIDTVPPVLVLESNGRRGSLASVRWDVKDENLDLKSLILEYQVEGGRDWRTRKIDRFGLIGRQDWDAGTAEPLKVRASIADKAGNVTEKEILLPEGTPTNPSVASNGDAEFSSPPISQISSGPSFPTRDDPPPAGDVASAAPFAGQDPFAASDPNRPPTPAPADAGSTPFGAENDPFGGSGATSPAPEPAAAPPAAGPANGNGNGNGAGPSGVQLVANPRFPLQYAVDDAGPAGPAKVELWVTRDNGRNWSVKAEDEDKTSPFLVDLGGEGTFGLRLVARSATGLGDTPPAPGDPPHMTVEVDSTPPTVQLLKPVVGTGAHVGKVAITWKASDLHLGAKSARLSWRPEQAGTRWQPIAEGLDANGQFVWTVPTNVPPRFHLRVDVVDEAGNVGFAETTDGLPVYLDRNRPRTRIIGLDRTGLRPGAGQVR